MFPVTLCVLWHIYNCMGGETAEAGSCSQEWLYIMSFCLHKTYRD